MHTDTLTPIVAELAARPGHEKVRTLLHRLLTDGLGAASHDIDFEKRLPEVQGRIDAVLGRTAFELKSDLRRERDDAESQLRRYLPEREATTGRRFIGVATDGAEWQPYEMRGGALAPLGPRFAPNLKEPRAILVWLESVVTLHERLSPGIVAIGMELGRESLAYGRAVPELARLWQAAEGNPEARLKRDVWNRLLSVSYGAEVGSDALFLQHTYLTVVAKAIATLALLDHLPGDAGALMAGVPFRDRGIAGAVEADFFDWVLLAPEGAALVGRIALHVARFDFAEVDVDILKGLYESLIDPAERRFLGEYYTPDWLASRIVAAAVNAPLEERVIDPACGSGTFLFHAVRRVLAAARETGMGAAAAVARAIENVSGIDVHPVAVIFARVTYLLALAPALREGRPAGIAVPVYLGDALQWSTREFMGKHDLEIVVPPAEGEIRVELRFPFEAALDPGFFDELLEAMLRLAEKDRPDTDFRAWAEARGATGIETLVETYRTLAALQRSKRNHIWGYVARNQARPIWLASESRRADVVLGNPPWVDYRSMGTVIKERFREEMQVAGLWDAKAHGLAFDLSAYFFARAVHLYMKQTGAIAFVMPHAALSRAPYAPFRKGTFKSPGIPDAQVAFRQAWALPAELAPLFPVPACVLFAQRASGAQALPEKVLTLTGRLPRRDANEAEAARAVREEMEPWPAGRGEMQGSPYGRRFNAGAKLDPRRLVLVNRVPAGRLGDNPAAPLVEGRTGALDKMPWKEIDPPRGAVEAAFLRPVYLGESIGPFRLFEPVLGVIPVEPATHNLLDATMAGRRGFSGLSGWLEKSEAIWNSFSKGVSTFSQKLNFYSLLTRQFPLAPLRVVYAASGVHPAATLVNDPDGVIEHVLYWSAVESEDEGRYLAAIFNSEAARSRVERQQSIGQWGARHFDKVVFNLPIPLWEAADPLHRALAEEAAAAEAVAGAVPLREGEHFTRARRRIREALAADGVAGRIDGLVARLLDR